MNFFDSDLTISMALSGRARREPTAVYCLAGDRMVTVAEIDHRVGQLSVALVERGLQPGDRVATMMGNHIEHVALIFAIMRAGLVWVPVNRKLVGASVERILRSGRPRLIVADRC